VDTSGGLGPVHLEGKAAREDTSLNLGGLFGGKELGKGANHVTDTIEIKLVLTAEVGDDLGTRTFFDRVPVVVGELEVFDAGAVFVFAGGGADEHDAIDMAQKWLFVLPSNCQTPV